MTSPSTKPPRSGYPESADLTQHPHPGAGFGLGLRRRTGYCAPTCMSPTRTAPSARSCASAPAESTRTCPASADADGTYSAILGDPRNDENVIIAGLHCAHILFYNRVLDELDSHRLDAVPVRPPRRPLLRLHRVPDRPRDHAVALPVAAGQRAPAPDRRPSHRRRRSGPRQPLLPASRSRRVHAHRVRRRRLPLRSQHGPPLVPSQLHQRHRRQLRPDRGPVLRPGLRPHRAGLLGARRPTTATTCWGATPPPAGTSDGRRSSTSATARSRTTRRSTPPSPASFSPSRYPQSPPTPRPRRPCCPNATCSAS